MARKAKKRSRRPTASRQRKAAPPFFGDRLLAAFLGITSCCGVLALSVLSAAAFGFAAADSLRSEIRKTLEDPATAWMLDPQSGLSVGILAAAMAIFLVALTIGTWKSRKWALVILLVLHLGWGVAGYVMKSPWTSLIPNALISAYCATRLLGWIGSRPT